MKKIILCPNPYRDKGMEAAREAAEILGKVGIRTVFCLPFRMEGETAPAGMEVRPLYQELRGIDPDTDRVLKQIEETASMFCAAEAQITSKDIRSKLEEKTSRLLDSQSGSSTEMIQALQKEYEDRHTEYAHEILKKITEV